MSKKKELSELVTEELKSRMKAHLYSKSALLGTDSPFSELLQEMVNELLEGEMDTFQAEQSKSGKPNKRNGKQSKQVSSTAGPLTIHTPRDRNGDFEPSIIAKRERVLSSGLDDQILALYAQGNSIEDVRRLLVKIYGVSMSAGQISSITDKVLSKIEAWQNRPLSAFYSVVFLDAIHFKVRYNGVYQTRAFYTVYSVDWEGNRDLLGMYVQGNEGAMRWGIVLEDLKKRGVSDILVVCTDDLQGFSERIADSFPDSIVQKCVVHQVRNSLKFVDSVDMKKVAADLRKIYTSTTEADAKISLTAFEQKWSSKYRYIVKQWEKNWEELTAFMHFPMGMRRMIYTTNPVEALHRIIRKMVKSKAAWVSDTALIKQLYLSLMHNEKSWKKKAQGWNAVQRDLLELYEDRILKWQ